MLKSFMITHAGLSRFTETPRVVAEQEGHGLQEMHPGR